MKTTIAVGTLAALFLFSLTSATGTLQLGITGKREVASSQNLRRRDNSSSGTVTAPLTEDALFVRYYADVTIGTPPQALKLIVDTGSSDVWAVASTAQLCATNDGCPDGTFDQTKSSTFDDNGQGQFQDQYADGSQTTGDFFKDNFGIGGVTVEAFQMGLALDTSLGKGILGIAFDTMEAGGTVQYPNLVDTMVNQNIIATTAYSLWLDDLNARAGSLLFGGVDTAKYEGNLANIAMYPSADTGTVDRFTVAFTTLTINSPSGSDTLTPPGYAEAVILDSGTTMTYLPDDLAQAIYNEVGAIYDTDQKLTVCSCGIASVQGTLDFQFAGAQGPVIKVPISEMVYPLTGTNGEQLNFTNGEPACLFGIEPQSSLGDGGALLFGDTLLRSAYVVYDLANFRIGLAQTKFNSTESNIVAFESNSAQIPGATTVTNENAVTQTAASGAVGATAAPTVAGQPGVQATSAMFTGNAGPAFASATAVAKKKNAAGSVPKPIMWEMSLFVGMIMGLMGMGGVALLL